MSRKLSPITITLLLITTATFAQRGERAPLNAQGMREHHEEGFPGTVADAVASFTRYYDLFDKERNGEEPLEAMSGGEAGEVRTLNRYKGWDKDKDGNISRAEMKSGIESSVNGLVEEQLKADADGDDALALAEYLLSIPQMAGPGSPALNTANQAKNANGLTARQQMMFDGSNRTSVNFQGLWQMLHHDPKADLDAMDAHITEFEKARKPAPTAGTSDAAAAKPEDAAAAFATFFTTIDQNHDGKVTVSELLDAHNAEASDTKTLAGLTAWDSNKDAFVTQAEGEAGVIAYVLDQVEQQLKADGDSNGVLSLNEFALAVPDPNGEKLVGSDVTKRQELMFRSADTDKDNQYARAEATASMARRSQYGYLGRRVAYRARVFDLNQDRKYDLPEFALIYGVKPGEPVPQAIQEKFKGQGASPGIHNYYNVMMRVIHFPLTEMDELEGRITAYEKQHVAHRAKAVSREKKE